MKYKLVIVDQAGETFAEAVCDNLPFLEVVEFSAMRGQEEQGFVFTTYYYEWRTDCWVRFDR